MSFTINTTVPKSLENTAIQYWTGVYKGDAEQIGDTLDPNVVVKAFDSMDGQPVPSVTLTGRDAVVEQALKMNEVVKSIENFGLSFALVTDNSDDEGRQMLAVKFSQNLVLEQAEGTPEVNMFSRGVELWQWEDVGTEGNEKIVFTAGLIFEKDNLSNHSSNQEELQNMVAYTIDANGGHAQPPAAQGWLQGCAIL